MNNVSMTQCVSYVSAKNTHTSTHPLIQTLSLLPRCVHHLLAAFLPDPRSEGPLQELLYLAITVQRCHVAGLPQQRSQPCHLHDFQHWVSQSLHQDPALLRAGKMTHVNCQEKKMCDVGLRSEVRMSRGKSKDKEVETVLIKRKVGIRK